MSENDPMEFVHTPKLVTPEQALNFMEQIAKEFSDEINNRPSPNSALNDTLFPSWLRKLCIRYGKCLGAMMALQFVGFMTVDYYMGLKKRLMGLFLKQTSIVELGNDR